MSWRIHQMIEYSVEQNQILVSAAENEAGWRVGLCDDRVYSLLQLQRLFAITVNKDDDGAVLGRGDEDGRVGEWR